MDLEGAEPCLEEVDADQEFANQEFADLDLDVCGPSDDQSVDSELPVDEEDQVPDDNAKESAPNDQEKSPLLISKSVNEDVDTPPSAQHVAVSDLMVVEALEVLDKQNVRGIAIETIVDYFVLRLPVNRDKEQLLTELSDKLKELVDGGVVHLGQNGKYRLSLFHEQAQQAEGRFGEPVPTVPPRPKSGRSPSRDSAGRSRDPRPRKRSGSSSTSSTSSGVSRYQSRGMSRSRRTASRSPTSRSRASRSPSRSPTSRSPVSRSSSPRRYPRLSPTYTKQHPRRSLRLKAKRQSRKYR